MAKTEITKKIERALSVWSPAKIGGVEINKMRVGFDALEVPVDCGTVTGGLVDYVAVQECFDDVTYYGHCRLSYRHNDDERTVELQGYESCRREIVPAPLGTDGMACDKLKCRFCYKRKEATCGILVTCVEIKVSKADFKSEHGHNFVGNCNFYAMPKDLYPQVKDLIPKGIGVLLYYDGGEKTEDPKTGYPVYPFVGVRKKIECEYRKLSDYEQKWLIMSTIKRKFKTDKQIAKKR